MPSLADFFILVMVVTASGALAPGPLFFGTVILGMKKGSPAGFMAAVGHTIVELPLVLIFAFGLLTAASQPTVKSIVGVVGGAALIAIGSMQIKGVWLQRKAGDEKKNIGFAVDNPLILGILLTGLNPFFIIWWLTVGSPLILEALLLAAVSGVVLMYAFHVWIDYAWLTLTASLAKKGRNVMSSLAYRLLLTLLSILIIYFGVTFLLNAL